MSFSELQPNTSGRRRWKPVLVALFALLFLAEVGLVIRQEKSQTVGAKAQKVAAQLIDFAQSRAERLPRRANEPFGPYEQRILSENALTQSLYSERYYQEVAYLQQALRQRGLSDPELDELYRGPASAIGVRDVGKRLFEMGAVLRSRRFF